MTSVIHGAAQCQNDVHYLGHARSEANTTANFKVMKPRTAHPDFCDISMTATKYKNRDAVPLINHYGGMVERIVTPPTKESSEKISLAAEIMMSENQRG